MIGGSRLSVKHSTQDTYPQTQATEADQFYSKSILKERSFDYRHRTEGNDYSINRRLDFDRSQEPLIKLQSAGPKANYPDFV